MSVRLYGLHDPSMGRIVEWYTSLDAIERELEVLEDGEPEWAAQLEIVTVAVPQRKTSPAPAKLKRAKS
jgi:hypothetical protein